MAESFKSWSDIQTDLADNASRSITARLLRDAINSFRAFGGLQVTGGATATGALSTSYTTITQWSSVDANSDGVTANATTGVLTVEAAGLYQVDYNITAGISDASSEYLFGILKNSETTPTTGTKQSYKHTSNAAYHPISAHAVLNLAAGDALKLAVAVDTGTPTITPKEGTFYVKRIA